MYCTDYIEERLPYKLKKKVYNTLCKSKSCAVGCVVPDVSKDRIVNNTATTHNIWIFNDAVRTSRLINVVYILAARYEIFISLAFVGELM